MRGTKVKRLRRELGVAHPGRLKEPRFQAQTRESTTGFLGRKMRRKLSKRKKQR